MLYPGWVYDQAKLCYTPNTMKTLKIIVIVVATIIILAGTTFFLVGYLKPKPGGIFVDTSPASDVYVNENFSGKTPLKLSMSSGTISLKLVPQVKDQNLLPFETKITLVSGIETVVEREFGITEDASSGDIVSFEKEGTSASGLVIISTPDNAQVLLDGVPRGFAPYKTSTIAPAEHQITVKAPGFIDRIITVKTRAGYRLNLFAKLAKSTQEETIVPTPTPQVTVFVTILDTPTAYLRVRTLPGTKGEEIGQVKPGQKFPFLEKDEATGWYKIRFEEPKAGLPNGISGWISNQFATKPDESATPSATPAI